MCERSDEIERVSQTVELIPLFGRSHGPRQTVTITLPRVRFLETPAAVDEVPPPAARPAARRR